MSFQADLEARYGVQNIIRWSNPDSKTAITANAVVIAAALVDASGCFRDYAGVLYDSTDNRMIRIACKLAVAFMRSQFADAGSFKTLKDEAIQELKDLRKVTNANRLVPSKKQINSYVNIDTNAALADSRKLSRLGYPVLNDTRPALPTD